MNLRAELDRRMSEAFQAAGIPADVPVMIALPARPQFGDYQANGVMAAAKRMGTNPRQLAEKVVAAAGPILVGPDKLAEKVEVAGPGFINIHLNKAWLSSVLNGILGGADGRLGVPDKPERRQTVVVDYSAPNLAKEMHVGHLRSTIIGDALARVLDFIGHEVIRQNHVGDWGTQFGMVILGMWHISMARNRQDPTYIKRKLEDLIAIPPKSEVSVRKRALEDFHKIQQEDLLGDRDGEKVFHTFIKEVVRLRSLGLGDIEEAYRLVNLVETLAAGTGHAVAASRDEDPPQAVESLSSYITARFLQKKDENRNQQEKTAWAYARDLTLDACEVLYRRLNITLEREHVRGESAYDDDLANVVAFLDAAGLLTKSQGAQCVFLDEFKGKDGELLPVIVQKSDKGYLYATTDLAAMRYRANVLHADRILYVTDARQSLHFQQVFAVARRAQFVGEGVLLEHVPFGTMMGADGRPFKTRTGGTVKLLDLLDEAQQRALAFVSQKNPDLPKEQREQIARAVGIGAVKYADLSQNRSSDYVFSWDKMLSLDGNTAPYMQYAYARVRSIQRKGKAEALKSAGPLSVRGMVSIEAAAERILALKLLQFPETVETVARDCLPSVLCAYLYDLAGAFMGFYESCPVLKAPDEGTRASRLLLCELTARTIQTGLNLLGIETIEQM